MIPDFNQDDDLPIGIHPATLAEIMERFGKGTGQRQAVARRLELAARLDALLQDAGR